MAAISEREPYYTTDNPKIDVVNISIPSMQSKRTLDGTFLYVKPSLSNYCFLFLLKRLSGMPRPNDAM